MRLSMPVTIDGHVRKSSDGGSSKIAAVQTSVVGTSRHFTAPHNLRRYRDIADMAGFAEGSARSRMTRGLISLATECICYFGGPE